MAKVFSYFCYHFSTTQHSSIHLLLKEFLLSSFHYGKRTNNLNSIQKMQVNSNFYLTFPSHHSNLHELLFSLGFKTSIHVPFVWVPAPFHPPPKTAHVRSNWIEQFKATRFPSIFYTIGSFYSTILCQYISP